MVITITQSQPNTVTPFLPPEPIAPTLSPLASTCSPVTLVLAFCHLHPSDAHMTNP